VFSENTRTRHAGRDIRRASAPDTRDWHMEHARTYLLTGSELRVKTLSVECCGGVEGHAGRNVKDHQPSELPGCCLPIAKANGDTKPVLSRARGFRVPPAAFSAQVFLLGSFFFFGEESPALRKLFRSWGDSPLLPFLSSSFYYFSPFRSKSGRIGHERFTLMPPKNDSPGFKKPFPLPPRGGAASPPSDDGSEP
jgi:hypothetical protein